MPATCRWVLFCGVVVLMVVTTTACGAPAPAPDHDWQAAEQSRFGVDYVFPGMSVYVQKPYAARYAEAGLRWVNFADVRWKAYEPNPPVDGEHRYVWEKLDEAVLHWQSHGFQIAMTLRLAGGWFAGPVGYEPEEGIPLGIELVLPDSDRLPKPEYRDDYQAWLTALVERYDGDGTDDMPGLLNPVLHYQVGNEYGNPTFWTGTIDEYFALMALASDAILGAAPDAQLIPSGLRMNDVFHNDPDALYGEETLSAFVSTVPAAYQTLAWTSQELNERTLLLPPGSYDIVDAGSNGSWHTVSAGNYAYVSGLLALAGNDAQIWDMEARCEPLLTPLPTTHIHMELGVPGGEDVLAYIRNGLSPRHEAAVAWYRAEQARVLTKVFVTRFAAGFERVFMGMAADWDRGLSAWTWTNPYMGILDADGNAWPAHDTLALLVAELDGFEVATQVSVPDEDVRLYRFDFDDGREVVWVVWLEDIAPRGMDDPLPERKVTLDGVTIENAVAIPVDGTVREVDFVQQGDLLEITVSPTPLLLSR